MRQVILYGISGASRAYTVLNYFCIYEEFISISTILGEARRLRMKNPDVEHVYAIDNRYGLRRDYKESMKRNSIESITFSRIFWKEKVCELFNYRGGSRQGLFLFPQEWQFPL